TGVQTCALPISSTGAKARRTAAVAPVSPSDSSHRTGGGRASTRRTGVGGRQEGVSSMSHRGGHRGRQLLLLRLPFLRAKVMRIPEAYYRPLSLALAFPCARTKNSANGTTASSSGRS